MSFRLFVYYCAVCGGWAAFLGWGLGRLTAPQGPEAAFARTVYQGLVLGSAVALALGVLDALGSFSPGQVVQLGARAGVALAIGCGGSLLGAALGQWLFGLTGWAVFVVVGWALTGLLIGVSVGAYDVLTRALRGEDLSGAWRKVTHGLLGGALGGLLGSGLYLLLKADAQPSRISSAAGFVALGVCIGLFIGLAQIILKEAWITVEAGFRTGREMILSKAETVIGRAEECDVGLFGDPSVERAHARILRHENRYILADGGGPAGTFLNDQRITRPTPLRSGDLIRVGQNLLRFGERPRKP